MPVKKNKDGTYSIGGGKAKYPSRAAAERAYRGYLASRGKKKGKRR